LIIASAVAWLLGRPKLASASTLLGCAAGALAAACVFAGQANIEKHGVTYIGDRGSLARGICEVTVPDTHQKGTVERPSLLRFEIHEDQREHIVLISATELSAIDFKSRLSESVSNSPDRDVLVFIHGYNVDFESAVQRTAQIAVDLPFEGVPICYSWPSQGTLLGYSIDETNADWTDTHLKEFLLELAHESGASSINVIAHSMGNRPMTAAMQQIRWDWDRELDVPFDRIVLAAPDVDADRFRRDLAPALLDVAKQVTLYASSDDQALVASKQVHGYPRAGESGTAIVVVPGVETIDVSGIDLSLLGHSYYGDNASMLRDLFEVVRARLPAADRASLVPRREGELTYWQLSQRSNESNRK
jgi:esterase/lipase superfamily enzyme